MTKLVGRFILLSDTARPEDGLIGLICFRLLPAMLMRRFVTIDRCGPCQVKIK